MPQKPCKGADSWTVETHAEFEAFFLSDREIQSGWFVSFTQHPKFGAGWLAYRNPIKTLTAWELPEVAAILDEVGKEAEGGRFSAGFVSFDAAPAFDPAFVARRVKSSPLACFHIYEEPPRFYKEFLCSRPSDKLRIEWQPEIDRDAFLLKCGRVRQHLADGDTYQVNLSLRLYGDLDADLTSVFANLTAEDPPLYASLFMSDHTQVASLSPELFFERSGHKIRCRPMKGTAPLGSNPEETAANAKELEASEKNRAENLMIVDMIRNDLGRIAKIGSVKTTSIFAIEEHPTILQMTSTVEAEIDGSLRETFDALFPCASIVGAPKVETLKIIHEIEASPRGIYTGAIGTVGPGEARFSVAIRTISGQPGSSSRSYGAGSGIVWDSEPEAEWEETLLKTAALHQSSIEWELLETFRWPDPQGLFPRHLNRMARSARQLGIAFTPAPALRMVEALPHGPGLRVRLLLNRRGGLRIETVPFVPPPDVIQAKIAVDPISSADPSLRIKSTRRGVYNRRLGAVGTDEVLLWNENREATEFSKGNLVVKREGKFLTPPVQCGLLPGVLREKLLESGAIQEKRILIEDLLPADELYRINSLTGWVRVELIETK